MAVVRAPTNLELAKGEALDLEAYSADRDHVFLVKSIRSTVDSARRNQRFEDRLRGDALQQATTTTMLNTRIRDIEMDLWLSLR